MSGLSRGKGRQLFLLALVQVLAMGLWFSASAVLPQLGAELSLSAAAHSWITMSVQLGFVVGALTSALLNLPDRLPTERFMAACALLAALANGLVPLASPSLPAILALRFLTGGLLAGVYPPGMKLVATWTLRDRGFGIGLVVGALTLGSAAPHLLNALPWLGGHGMPPWRSVLFASSVLALVAAALAALAARPGPHRAPAAPFDWRFAGTALRHTPTRLANFGYLGHMWEIYAMWTWAPVLLLASFGSAGLPVSYARLAGFGTIAVGAVSCVLAGLLADRFGRTSVTIASLALSGACAALVGLLFSSPLALTALCLVWGFAVVADSAQFSAAVSELTDPRYVGTALTLQTCLGFLLTMGSIRLVPSLVDTLGWRWIFLLLVPGPIVGIWSMWRLRRHPEAARMASGRR